MRRESLERYPALAASAALHVGVVVAAMLLGALLNKPVYGPTVVPVTLVNSADMNPAPAVEAPTPTPSVTPPTPPTPPMPQVAPEPTPRPIQPVAPPPPPKPAPAPKPTPAPKPVSTPKPVKPAPPAKTETPPDDDAFLNSLSKDLAHSGKPSTPRPSTRPTTGTGNAPSAAALASLSAQLQRLWNPNCDVMGGADVNLTIRFVLGPSGRVIGQPISSMGDSSDPIVKAASDRAIRSVFQAQPITGLNPDHYTVNFNAKQACGQR